MTPTGVVFLYTCAELFRRQGGPGQILLGRTSRRVDPKPDDRLCLQGLRMSLRNVRNLNLSCYGVTTKETLGNLLGVMPNTTSATGHPITETISDCTKLRLLCTRAIDFGDSCLGLFVRKAPDLESSDH